MAMVLGTRPYQKTDVSGIMNLMISKEGLKLRQKELGLQERSIDIQEQKAPHEIDQMQNLSAMYEQQGRLFGLQADVAEMQKGLEEDLLSKEKEARRQEILARQSGARSVAEEAKTRATLAENARARVAAMSTDEAETLFFATEYSKLAQADKSAMQESMQALQFQLASQEQQIRLADAQLRAIQSAESTIDSIIGTGPAPPEAVADEAALRQAIRNDPGVPLDSPDMRERIQRIVESKREYQTKLREEDRKAAEDLKAAPRELPAPAAPDDLSPRATREFEPLTLGRAQTYYREHRKWPSDIRTIRDPRALRRWARGTDVLHIDRESADAMGLLEVYEKADSFDQVDNQSQTDSKGTVPLRDRSGNIYDVPAEEVDAFKRQYNLTEVK